MDHIALSRLLVTVETWRPTTDLKRAGLMHKKSKPY